MSLLDACLPTKIPLPSQNSTSCSHLASCSRTQASLNRLLRCQCKNPNSHLHCARRCSPAACDCQEYSCASRTETFMRGLACLQSAIPCLSAISQPFGKRLLHARVQRQFSQTAAAAKFKRNFYEQLLPQRSEDHFTNNCRRKVQKTATALRSHVSA